MSTEGAVVAVLCVGFLLIVGLLSDWARGIERRLDALESSGPMGLRRWE